MDKEKAKLYAQIKELTEALQKEINRDKYNGWSNWETWNVNLWLTNDAGVYQMTNELLRRKYNYDFERAEALKDFIYDLVHGNECEGIPVYIKDDISLHRVDYKEITDSFLSDMKEQEAYQKHNGQTKRRSK